MRTLDRTFRSIDNVQDEKENLLVVLAERTVEENAADVVLLAGAPLAGLAPKLAAWIAHEESTGAAQR